MSLRTLTNSNFNLFAEAISAPSKPTDYCEAAMGRVMQYLNPYIVHVKGVRFKYHARNKVELIHFQSRAEREAYDKAYEDYLKACAENEEKGDMGSFGVLVELLKFRQAAELIRAPYLARRMYDIVNKKQRAAIGALSFKETTIKITSILVDDYCVPRSEISLIWGGYTQKKLKKKKLTEAQVDRVRDLFGNMDTELLESLGIYLDEGDKKAEMDNSHKNTEMKLLCDRLELGPQSKKKRQENIDDFQRDRSKYCLFTFKSGGVGLSLHQETPENRVRETLLAPVYSAIELVQGLGRAPRLTSCSDTEQTVVFYADTIETRVAQIASMKLKCLSKCVQKKESWEDVLFGVSKIEREDEEVESEEDADAMLAGGGDSIIESTEEEDNEE